MFNRIITALFLASFFILLLVFFNPIILGLVLTMIAILAFNEWINLMNIANSRKKIIFTLFFLGMIGLLYFSNYELTNYINKIYLMFWIFISLDILLKLGLTQVVLKRLPVLLAFFV
ncbi:MAG: phosphatidate cytidylyltransferase, partial [Pseudomonadota bacterium]|nr:phosphatidate cytidylyltransferase [Pseudomonadota bacterium]